MVAQYDIFVSYARSDNKNGQVSQFVDNLKLAYEKSAGRPLRIFLDKNSIGIADIWEVKIAAALENSWLMLPLLSREFFRSPWCARELSEFLKLEQLAKEQNHFHDGTGLVMPVRYLEFEEDDPDAWMEISLRRNVFDRQWIDFDSLKPETTPYIDALRLLVRRIQAILEPLISDGLLERLPITKNLNVEEIEYGEGVQIELVAGGQLIHVDLYSVINKEFVNFDGTFQYLPRRVVDNGALKASQLIRVPHRIVVRGRRSCRGTIVGIYVCVGIHYFQGLDRLRNADLYEVECTIGRGGIADFVDSSGRFQDDNPLIFGDGLGAVCGIVAVEFEGRNPVRRSEHVLVVRAGIRYPEDIWISSDTGMPVASKNEDISMARFIFQSRQPNGQSCDIFAADFNGSNMINLTEKQENAYDGFFGESGAQVARWIDQSTVQYCSMSGGRRIIKRVRDQY